MVCPSCSAAVADGAAECASCGVIFAKWEKRRSVPAGPPAPPAAPALLCDYAVPGSAAAVFALYQAWRFSSYLPLPEGWGTVQRWLFPMAALTLAFHEAGHALLGVLGWQFLTVAGGTLFQLLFPGIIVGHFASRGDRAGVWFGVFWLGQSLIDASYYAADAKAQVIILLSGTSGSEGGFHDWGYMLDVLHLKGACIGIGRFLFFLGCLAMALAVCVGVRAAWRRAWRWRGAGPGG